MEGHEREREATLHLSCREGKLSVDLSRMISSVVVDAQLRTSVYISLIASLSALIITTGQEEI